MQSDIKKIKVQFSLTSNLQTQLQNRFFITLKIDYFINEKRKIQVKMKIKEEKLL